MTPQEAHDACYKEVIEADSSCDVSFALNRFANRLLAYYEEQLDKALDGEYVRAVDVPALQKYLEEFSV